MCPPKINIPKQTAPAAAPPPAAPAATMVQADAVRDENIQGSAGLKSRKRGRNALRIDLNPGQGSTGLNIPNA